MTVVVEISAENKHKMTFRQFAYFLKCSGIDIRREFRMYRGTNNTNVMLVQDDMCRMLHEVPLNITLLDDYEEEQL